MQGYNNCSIIIWYHRISLEERSQISLARSKMVEMVVEGETGFTFPPGDAQTLAAHMTDLLDHPAKAVAMGERGHARLIREFSVVRYMHDIHAAYNAVLARRPLPPGVPLWDGETRDASR